MDIKTYNLLKQREELKTPQGKKAFIEDNFELINKDGQRVPFRLNSIQEKYLLHDRSNRDIILKARQQGFSSLILALFTSDFINVENSRSVVVADIDDNSSELLDRVKFYIRSYEEKNKVKIPLKYNSKSELYNTNNGARYSIGTAKNAEFGRSKTITNLHLSEAAFYPNLERILAGAGNAVTPNGYIVLETTANGFNEFKALWDDSKLGTEEFKPLFYKASEFYDEAFLISKGKNNPNKKLFKQEYPEKDIEAFLTSGDLYFDADSLQWYLDNAAKTIREVEYV